MLVNYLGTLLYLLAVWMLGLAALKLSRLTDKPYPIHFISFPVGISVCALLANIGYLRLDLSLDGVRLLYAFFALAALVILIWKKVSKKEILGFLALLAIFHIMLLPGLFHGVKYYVHRGNIWDKYFYLSEVVFMGQYKYNDDISLASEIIQVGKTHVLSDRPTAPLLCAVLTGKSWGNLFFQAYLFIILMWSSIWGAILLMLNMASTCIKKNASKMQSVLYGILAAVYIWGFYGQLQYDIDAWSQMVSSAGLIGFASLFFIELKDIFWEQKQFPLKHFFIMLIMGTGLFLIYPENTMIYGALMVLAAVLSFFICRQKVSWKNLCICFSLPVLILLCAKIIDSKTVDFALGQITSSGSDVRQSWAGYFDQYWLGYAPLNRNGSFKSVIKSILNFLPSICGMFFITPQYHAVGIILKYIWMLLMFIVSIGLILLYFHGWKCQHKTVKSSESCLQGYFLQFGLIGILLFFGMVFMGKYWSAGKLLLYISPAFFLVLSLPVLTMIDGKWEAQSKKSAWGKMIQRGLLIISSLFVISQFLFGCMRLHDVLVNKDCTGYLGNYPSDQFPSLKESYPYHFNAEKYKDEEMVAILIDNGWYQDYVKLSLAYEGISYYGVPTYQSGYNVLSDSQAVYVEGDTVITVSDTE